MIIIPEHLRLLACGITIKDPGTNQTAWLQDLWEAGENPRAKYLSKKAHRASEEDKGFRLPGTPRTLLLGSGCLCVGRGPPQPEGSVKSSLADLQPPLEIHPSPALQSLCSSVESRSRVSNEQLAWCPWCRPGSPAGMKLI